MASNGSSNHMKGFYAYPSMPYELGSTIRATVEELRKYTLNPEIELWEESDIFGNFIPGNVRSSIRESDFLLADITELNYNVTFEIGYAIGLGKKVLLTKNSSFRDSHKHEALGLFDTIGRKSYQNSKELLQILRGIKDIENKSYPNIPPRTDSPLYIIEPKFKNDQIIGLIARIKKTGLKFRSFDPQESIRLSCLDAIEEVNRSFGVLLYFLNELQEDYLFHNHRACFLAGLTLGLEKEIVIFQFDDSSIPMDLRDIVFPARHPKDVQEKVHDFASTITQKLQEKRPIFTSTSSNVLGNINLGASSAENELSDLGSYYLQTDEFKRTKRGEVRIVVGRKGAGKTAIFSQTKEFTTQFSKNLVLDLKPDGYKLLKFKETVLSLMNNGTMEHTLMAIWEYILWLELCHKIITTDKQNHLRDAELFDSYNRILTLYQATSYDSEGDFSERLSLLLERIQTEYLSKFSADPKRDLNAAEITNLIYSNDLRSLRNEVEQYLRKKDQVWVLFDNLDKGWPSHGVQQEDVVIIKTLIEALRKLERQLQKHQIETHSIIFLRNDVYELLIAGTADRGKEAKAIIDWKDTELLKELLKRRLLNNIEFAEFSDRNFEEIWNHICIPLYKGERTGDFLIDRSLMRPRFLIDLVNKCKGVAVNLNHPIITDTDIEKALYDYSSELVAHINLEIQDVYPTNENILYTLIESNAKTTIYQIEQLLLTNQIDPGKIEEIIDILLWHAVLGISSQPDETKYIYDFNYDIHLMKAFIKAKKMTDGICCVINPAFWPALAIKNNV